jgi:hypothetical protein
MSEVRKNHPLEGLDLILQAHKISNSLVSFVGIVDALEGDILLILEQAIEFRAETVEAKLGQNELDVCSN